MSIHENKIRVGNFTSSSIHKLMTLATDKVSFGKPALTYIAEKNLERKLCRSLEIEKSSRATLWGKFLEQRVHDLIGLDYEMCGSITVQHPSISFWVGSPDDKNIKESVVGDTKCYEPKNFAEYIDVLKKGDTELFKREFPKEYWQLLSNAIILGMKYIEPKVYMPYKSEIPEIREMAENADGPDQFKYRFIAEAPIVELAYLPDNNLYYKNLNIFRFEAPKADKDALTEKVEAAGKLLINL